MGDIIEKSMELKTDSAEEKNRKIEERRTVSSLAAALGAQWLVEGEKDRPIETGYVCDLLSWAMARLPEGAAWLTVMGHLNAVAVCSLKDGACILLMDNAPLDENAKARAEIEGIPILRVEAGAYETALRLGAFLEETP